MTRPDLQSLVDHLRRAVDSDSELLERFVRHRDASAFELLVRRHELLVLGVCRRVLGKSSDVADAFQATFLILVRKARTIGRRDALPAWLHRVAFRVALRARADAARRAAEPLAGREDLLASPCDPTADAVWRDLRPVLDRELNRLPDRYRVPLLLCDLDGLTYAEAARQLACSRQNLWARLARGRELLRQRLVRRGLTLAGGLLTVLAADATASGHDSLVTRAVQSVLDPAASGRALTLTQGVINAMWLTKMKVTAVGLLLTAVAVVGLAAGIASQFSQAQPPTLPAQDDASKPKPAQAPAAGETWTERLTLRVAMDDVKSVAFSPDGKTLATGGLDGTVALWDHAGLTSLEPDSPLRHAAMAEFKTRIRNLQSLAISPDGKVLAVAGGEPDKSGSVAFYDLAKAEEIVTVVVFGDLATSLAYSPDGKTLAVGCVGGSVALLDAQIGKKQGPLLGQQRAVFGVAFSPDGKTLAAVGGDPIIRQKDNGPFEIKLWDVATGKQLKSLAGHTATVSGVAFSADGKTLATSSFDRTAILWDLTGKRDPRVFEGPAFLRGVALSTDGRTLAAGSFDETVQLWDLVAGQAHSLVGHKGVVQCLAFSPDGKTLATGNGPMRYKAEEKGTPMVKLWRLHSRPREEKPKDPLDEAVSVKLREAFRMKSFQEAYSTFYRRFHLDVVGVSPSETDIQKFLQANPQERVAKLDKLIEDAVVQKRWTEADQKRLRKVLVEALLGLDQ